MGKLEAVIEAQNRMNAAAVALADWATCETSGDDPNEDARHSLCLRAHYLETKADFNAAMESAQTRETR